MEEMLKKFELLALDWLKATPKLDNWNERSENVKIYHAAHSNHCAVYIGRYGCRIEISFHNPVEFGGITTKFVKNEAAVYRQAARELKEYIAGKTPVETNVVNLNQARQACVK